MSEESNQEQLTYGSWRPWHPRGIQVWLPLPGDAKLALAAVNEALDAGWLVTAPGLEEGEEREMVGWVCKREIDGNRGTCPLVLLYPENEATHFSFLTVYLNNQDDVDAFEYASKMKIAKLPLYVGDNKPERGKSKQVDQFIVAAPKAFGVVWKRNPKYDADAATDAKAKGGIYKIPTRLFVRWIDQKPAADNGKPAKTADTKPADGMDGTVVQAWKDWLEGEPQPTIDEINERLPQIKQLDGAATRMAVFTMLRAGLEPHHIRWDGEQKLFVFGDTADMHF